MLPRRRFALGSCRSILPRCFALTAGMLTAPALLAGGPDFNHDGYADLVVGTPFASSSRGITQMVMGSDVGLWPSPVMTLHQDLEGVPEIAAPHDEFGMAMAWGDFDGDGFDDLAVGVPNEGVGQSAQAGCVHIFYGWPYGLTLAGTQLWHQNRPGVPDDVSGDELFGWALVAGDFDGDGFADLAIGVPHQRVHNRTHAGGVNVLYGSANGLRSAGAQFFTQDSVGIPGRPDPGNLFGHTLARGDFNGDGFDDLAIGAPEDFVSGAHLGSVTILLGSASGLGAAGAQRWHAMNLPPGTGATKEFGYALAAGDFNGDGRDDLAVGSPFQATLSGLVTVLPGFDAGLDGAHAIAWRQSQLKDIAPPDIHLFGWALVAGDFNADGYADLAIGVPGETLTTSGDNMAGEVIVVSGSSDGLDTDTAEVWTQDDIPATNGVQENEWFGYTLACGDFDGDGADDLVISAPFEDVSGVRDSGSITILPGSPIGFNAAAAQFWTQPTLGRPRVQDEAMGFSLMR